MKHLTDITKSYVPLITLVTIVLFAIAVTRGYDRMENNNNNHFTSLESGLFNASNSMANSFSRISMWQNDIDFDIKTLKVGQEIARNERVELRNNLSEKINDVRILAENSKAVLDSRNWFFIGKTNTTSDSIRN